MIGCDIYQCNKRSLFSITEPTALLYVRYLAESLLANQEMLAKH